MAIIKETRGDKVFNIVNLILVTLCVLLVLYPLYFILIASFSNPNLVAAGKVWFYPREMTLDAYRTVFKNKDIVIGYLNTIFYAVFGTLFSLAMTLTSAYALSKRHFIGRNVIMFFFAFTMYFGGGLIPSFLLVNKMGLMDTCWAILLPGACNVWNIIIMRTQFVNIPDGLKEVATIDGASDVTILFRILIPLSGAVIAVLVLFSAVGYWNMWYEPMIYLTKRSQYPIQSVLREILIDSNAQMMAGAGKTQIKLSNTKDPAIQTLVKYANIVVCTIPILVVYPFAQKYFVKGVMVGSLKG